MASRLRQFAEAIRFVQPEQRSVPFNWPMHTPWGSESLTGVNVSRDTAIGLSAVWACVRLLSGAVSRMPVDTLITNAQGVPVPYQEPRWLRRPVLSNPNFDRVQHFSQVMVSLLLDGNMFVLTPRDDSNDVSELYVLDPQKVTIRGTVAEPRYEVQYETRTVEYGPTEVLHRPLISVPGSMRGISPLEAARQVFGLGLAAQEYGARFYSQSARPDGYIKVDAGTKTTAQELAAGWDSAHAGLKNAHKTGVLIGAEWKQLQPTHEQMEFIATRRFQVAEVARIYNVPPWMVGDVDKSTSFGTGIEEQSSAFVTYTLNDYLVILESAYSSIVPNPNSYLRFNRNALLRGKATDRATFYRALFDMGSLSPNEIRAKEDMPPIDGGDEYFVPLQYGSAENVANPPEDPEPEPALTDEDADDDQ